MEETKFRVSVGRISQLVDSWLPATDTTTTPAPAPIRIAGLNGSERAGVGYRKRAGEVTKDERSRKWLERSTGKSRRGAMKPKAKTHPFKVGQRMTLPRDDSDDGSDAEVSKSTSFKR